MQGLDGSELSTLRRLNERAVLGALYRSRDHHTVSQLAFTTGLSRPTVESALTQLTSDGWVREDEPERTARAGRPAKRYSFARDRSCLVGIDIGPHRVAASVADLHGTVLTHHEQADLDLRKGKAAYAALTSAVDTVLAQTGRRDTDILALTAGVPAVVGGDGDIALTTVVNSWRTWGFTGQVRRRYAPAAVFFENDAKLATIAEREWGAARGVATAVNILVGLRPAAGLIIGGDLARGAHGAAGEIGALPLIGWTTVTTRLVGDDDALRETLAQAREGVSAATVQLDAFAEGLAGGVAALCLAVDPDLVIVGGGVGSLGSVLVDPLSRRLHELVLFPVPVVASTLGRAAVAHGAVARGLDHLRRDVLLLDDATLA